MSAIVVREGSSADRAFIEDLGKRTVVDSIAAFREYNESLVEVAFERLLIFVYDQTHRVFIAERDGVALGFLLMLENLPDEVTLMPQGFIAYMAVDPSERRSGAAKALLEAAEGAARNLGLPYIALMVTEDNQGARNLYEAAGYLTERRLLCKTL